MDDFKPTRARAPTRGKQHGTTLITALGAAWVVIALIWGAGTLFRIAGLAFVTVGLVGMIRRWRPRPVQRRMSELGETTEFHGKLEAQPPIGAFCQSDDTALSGQMHDDALGPDGSQEAQSCEACGRRLRPKFKFCPRCGKAV